MGLFGSALFTGIMFISVLPYSLVVIAARLFGARASYAAIIGWTRAMVWLLKKLCGLDFEVTGTQRLPADASVALIKHSSAYETLVQMLILPRQCWVLKRELIWTPFLGWALSTTHPIAINRRAGRSAVEQVVRQGCQRLKQGIWVTIFPEGTRMAPGQTRRYGISGVLLAQKAGRKIVPIAHNAGDYWPRRGLRKKPGTVRFVIGEPVDPTGRDLRELNEDIQRWMEATVARLRNTPPV